MRSTASNITSLSPAPTCGLPSAIPGSECQRTSWSGCSSRSSRPRRPGKEPGRGLAKFAASPTNKRGPGNTAATRGKAPPPTISPPALPASTEAEQTTEPALATANAVPTILLVEDDHDVRAYVVEIL